MSLVVSKSLPVVVRPSEPVTTATKIMLSPMDKILSNVAVRALLAFEIPIHEPAETIKRGLSRALVYYYPIAGRLAAAADGDIYINCTGEGVTFISASANYAMKEIMSSVDQHPPDVPATAVLLELTANYSAQGVSRTDPLLLMQVTMFSCGGFIVGVTWNHALADGFGMAEFLQAVGELARQLPKPSVVPVRWDESAQVMPPSLLAACYQIARCLPLPNIVEQNITIPWSLIRHIRGDTDGQTCSCTMFEAVAAVLWQCRTRTVMCDDRPDAPTVLYFWVNARKYMGAKDGYYGNCITTNMAVAKIGTVANGDIMDVVGMIRRAKEQIPEQFNKDADMAIGDQLSHWQAGYDNALMLTSWRNLGFEDVDFGGGKMARVMSTCLILISSCQCAWCAYLAKGN
ncbi:hypothetical protein GUJ93_ZPchr0012g21822 [Zizania palustris]|uniref:Uncharacterized protein n=1 Tax=Zizania palustris TaxID=103762 RepID=A0A8J5WQD6_ZIZPA|nr:hypothetical protein GUJ93_ZPchr0012g21822 [Zizania palustris]